MRSLFRLVDDVIIDVLSHWIDAQSLARVDSACCNKIDRIALLELISKPHFTTFSGALLESVDEYLLWCTQRKLKLSSFKFGHQINCAIKLNLFSRMSEIHIELSRSSAIDVRWMGKLINCSDVLDKIIVTGENYQSDRRFEALFLHINNLILNRLKVIQFNYDKEEGISISVASYLKSHCHALREITINRARGGCVHDLAQLVLNNSQTLQRISIHFPFNALVDESIVLAAQQCGDLTELTLSGLQFVDTRILSETAKLVRAAPQLHTLRLEGIDNNITHAVLFDISRTKGDVMLCTSGWSMSGVSGQVWLELLNAVRVVHHLSFIKCKDFNNDIFRQISAVQPHLFAFVLRDENAAICTSLQILREIFPQCQALIINSDRWTTTTNEG